MSNAIQVFENKYMAVMAELSAIEQQRKIIEKKAKEIKAELEKAMDEYNIQSIDNEFVKITRVEASESKTIDLNKLQEKEPDLYNELLEDYPKITKRKAYVKITVK